MDRSSTKDSRPPNEVMGERAREDWLSAPQRVSFWFSILDPAALVERDQINEMAVVSAMKKRGRKMSDLCDTMGQFLSTTWGCVMNGSELMMLAHNRFVPNTLTGLLPSKQSFSNNQTAIRLCASPNIITKKGGEHGIKPDDDDATKARRKLHPTPIVELGRCDVTVV